MEAIKINKINKYLLVVFFILQPLLELILSVFQDKSFAIAGISIATLIRYGLISLIIILAITANINRKSTKLFIGTLIIYAIFACIHYFNIKNFDIIIFNTSMKKGIITTIMYISKFVIPICLIYLVYILELNYKDLKFTVLSIVTFVSLVMIITNLLGIDYISYSFNTSTHPSLNIIGWFNNEYDSASWRMLTSRGLYPSGNEVASLLTLLFPLTLWISLKEKRNYYFIFAFIQMISILMVGTKVAVYGEIILFVAVIFIWIFESILKKQKIKKGKILFLCLLMLVFSIFLINSPFIKRLRVGEGGSSSYTQMSEEESEKIKIELSEADNTPELIYIKENYSKESIPSELVENAYNYLEHTDFWVSLISDVDFSQRNNARKIKTLILQDIKDNKAGVLDTLVGIGEFPIYPEKDYIAQYYYIGVIGLLIFLMPFFLIAIASLFYGLIRLFKKKINSMQLVLLLSFFFIIAVAYFSGHTLEPIYINTLIGLICGMLLSQLVKREKENITCNGMEKYIKRVYRDGKESFLSKLEDNIKSDKKTFIVTANPETLMIANKNQEFDKCLMDENTLIVPDGIGVLKGASLLSYNIKETITGVELCSDIFRILNDTNKSIYLFGAKREVIEKLRDNLKLEYPNLNIVGIEDGYVKDKQKAFENIKLLKPDAVLIALGIPHQELLIYNNLKDFNKGIFIGVGGSFDVLSGTKKRAPKLFINMHLEWLYRIVTEPSRLKRFLNSNAKYVLKIIQER